MAKLIPELSAVMPAYNEQEVLPTALSEAVSALENLCGRWELRVVDDGSTDATPAILKEWSTKDARIRVLTQEHNSGYSQALIRGFSECRCEAVFYTDADAQFDLHDIARLYPRLADADLVAGYRVDRRDRFIRLATSGVYNLLQGWVLGLRVRDVNCAFKLFRRSFFDQVKLSSDGFLIDAEIYARAKMAGLTWIQVGVPHRPRQLGSTTVRAATILETLRELRALRRRIRQEARGLADSDERPAAVAR